MSQGYQLSGLALCNKALHDENGLPTAEPLQEPMLPTELAARLAALEPSTPPGPSPLESNLKTLARLLNLSPAES